MDNTHLEQLHDLHAQKLEVQQSKRQQVEVEAQIMRNAAILNKESSEIRVQKIKSEYHHYLVQAKNWELH